MFSLVCCCVGCCCSGFVVFFVVWRSLFVFGCVCSLLIGVVRCLFRVIRCLLLVGGWWLSVVRVCCLLFGVC